MTIGERIGFVTLATTDSYAAGALVLARSLRQVNTVAELVCLVSNSISEGTRTRLASEFDDVIVVDVLNSNDDAMLTLLKRPELGVTLTKLHCWKLTQYNKMVFLDADALVVKNIDDLFQREEISAVADCGWPSCFNSGVFVFKPSVDTFNELIEFAKNEGSFDGGDQGLLNDFFSDWSTKSIDRILPFGYNVHAAATYAYVPAFRRFKDQVKVVHFLGSTKPWTSKNPPQGEFSQFWQLWWSLYESNNQAKSSENVSQNTSNNNSVETPVMTPSGFAAVGQSQPGFTPTSPAKAGFDIIQDHLNAQLSSEASEPAPKFDIKPSKVMF
ncbi:Oidioi.mRNA.OKI2018_I69.PAR.g12481.t1.cds [Oikopleura dioica]|uniref:glycogenin glucosyltransferase n=1 Tax=Oikopleura dioica TaxID=34765 RepID=A0ABN7S089_OIKDI|nr:Oidioi.mRNA.OKI2018_I69.PAR.g12481.t1.cds [Oikopleura dioica]